MLPLWEVYILGLVINELLKACLAMAYPIKSMNFIYETIYSEWLDVQLKLGHMLEEDMTGRKKLTFPAPGSSEGLGVLAEWPCV